MTRLMSTLLLALLFVGATGCASYSEDRATYHSTLMEPKTVLVLDAQTQETLWSYPIPPGHVLMVEFDVGSGNLESLRQERGYPTTMEWALYPETAGRSLLRKQHFRGSSVVRGNEDFEPGQIPVLKMIVGEPVRYEDIAPPPRTVEEIQGDLLPEPDAPDADADVEDAGEDAVEDADEEMTEE